MNARALRIVTLTVLALALPPVIYEAIGACRAQGEKAGAYGKKGEVKAKAVRIESTATIDTTKKPDPDKDYVDVIVTHSQGDPLWADGGFFLEQTGKGYTIHRGGDGEPNVAAALEGYGSTQDTWVYEIKDLKIQTKKVYAALWKHGPDEQTPWPVYISLGVDDPTTLSSFGAVGEATRGKKQP